MKFGNDPFLKLRLANHEKFSDAHNMKHTKSSSESSRDKNVDKAVNIKLMNLQQISLLVLTL